MELTNLPKITGNKTRKTRVGRGVASGHGGHTATHGNKGQKARTGNSIPRAFEGGQVPLFKKLPKIGGFKSRKKLSNVSITTGMLNSFADGDEVSVSVLIQKGHVNAKAKIVKIVFKGELEKKLTLKGFDLSKNAQETILKSGSSIVD